MKSKNLSFRFAKDIGKFIILGRDIKTCLNLVVLIYIRILMIVMLSYLELNMEILDASMETM